MMMKTYVITLSQLFPVTHKRAGEQTGFKEKFFHGIDKERDDGKIHTIRANYELWEKRFKEIAEGRACLSVRQWSGKPYCSKQVELTRLTREDGIGLQKLEIVKEKLNSRPILLGYVNGVLQEGSRFFPLLAANDGLSIEDWNEWFKDYNLSKPLAIIHFTNFRY